MKFDKMLQYGAALIIGCILSTTSFAATNPEGSVCHTVAQIVQEEKDYAKEGGVEAEFNVEPVTVQAAVIGYLQGLEKKFGPAPAAFKAAVISAKSLVVLSSPQYQVVKIVWLDDKGCELKNIIIPAAVHYQVIREAATS